MIHEVVLRNVRCIALPPKGTYRLLGCRSSVLAVYKDGRIWNVRLGRWCVQDVDRDGYRILGGVGRVHRLVLLAFVGRPSRKGMVARHKDGDPANNRLGNLAWGTAQENWQDRKQHGRGTRSSEARQKQRASIIAFYKRKGSDDYRNTLPRH